MGTAAVAVAGSVFLFTFFLADHFLFAAVMDGACYLTYTRYSHQL